MIKDVTKLVDKRQGVMVQGVCEELWKDFTVTTEGAAFLETFDLSPDVNIFVSL